MRQKTVICGIVAVGPDNVIGQNGAMPWRSKQDFYHFKKMTVGFPCIFGKKTYAGLPRKPLPNRFNIVCSSKYTNKYFDGVFYASSLRNALAKCKKSEKVFICGGSSLYKYSLNKDLIDVMYVTRITDENLSEKIKSNPDEYIRFPYDIDTWFENSNWKKEYLVYRRSVLPKEVNAPSVRFYKYSRVR